MSELAQVVETANKVRKACETFSKLAEAESYLFYKDEGLTGMCAIASMALKEQLKKEGIETQVVHGKFSKHTGHCWIKYENLVIDITGTQYSVHGYNIPPVNVVRRNSKRYRPLFNDDADYDWFETWPLDQKADKNVVKRVLELVK